MSIEESSRVNWAYIAGFTDGDGCISYGVRVRNGWSNRWFCVRWGQTASNRMVIDEIAKFLHGKGIAARNVNVSVKKTRLGADYAELAVQRHEDVQAVLINMLPYLILKQGQAQEMLDVLTVWIDEASPRKKQNWERRRAKYGPTGRRKVGKEE